VFSNVRLSPETGDLGGLELELHPTELQPYALVVSCEGWCNLAHRVPLVIKGNRFSLAFSEALTQGGKPAGEDRYRISGRLADSALLVDFRMNSIREQVRLKRLKGRFGLNVAMANDEK